MHKKIKQHVLSHNAIRSTHPEGEGSGKFIPVLQMYGSTMPVKVFDMFLGKRYLILNVVSKYIQSFILYYHICTRLCTLLVRE